MVKELDNATKGDSLQIRRKGDDVDIIFSERVFNIEE